MDKHAKLHPAIYLLSLTAFAIGVAEFVVVGVECPQLREIADLRRQRPCRRGRT